uniref:non-specific serine/threonine protein kinase n=1 Tax=Fagus sylvatica TaxID=28930 RepID=A0A2N9GKY8_FAGSY
MPMCNSIGPLYLDDLEAILDEGLVSLNTEAEDGSVEEVAYKLMVMHEECLEGKFQIESLREANKQKVSVHRVKQEDGLLHTACGTPNYVAPEVLNDKGYDGTASDIWSCGVILFVLMAGYLPFDEPNLIALYRKISMADFACPPYFSPGAKELIKCILDPNPLTRITIPEILENEWFKKGYKPAYYEEEKNVNLDDVDAVFNDSEENLVTERKERPVSMNAFELISRSPSFNLENLYPLMT